MPLPPYLQEKLLIHLNNYLSEEEAEDFVWGYLMEDSACEISKKLTEQSGIQLLSDM